MTRLLALAVLLSPSVLAQQTLDPFTSQSAFLGVRTLSMGQAGAFLPDADPLAFAQNPARLAAAAGAPTLRLSLDGHPSHRRFFDSDFDSGLGYLAASYGTGSGAVGVVVSGTSESFLFTDDQGDELGQYEVGDQSIGLGGAVRIGDGRAHLDLGATARLTRLYGEQSVALDGVQDLSASEPSIDVGVLATVQIVPLGEMEVGAFAPTVTASAGYAQRSLGRDFDFGDPNGEAALRPQDRTGSVGLSVQFGLDSRLAGGRLQLARLDVAAEALATLNRAVFPPERGPVAIERSALLGDIRVRDALLGTSASSAVQGERGARLTIAETVWIAVGRTENDFGGSGNDRLTWGLGASVGGALRAIGALQNDADAVALGQRFDLTLGLARENRFFTQDGEREDDPFRTVRLFQIGGCDAALVERRRLQRCEALAVAAHLLADHVVHEPHLSRRAVGASDHERQARNRHHAVLGVEVPAVAGAAANHARGAARARRHAVGQKRVGERRHGLERLTEKRAGDGSRTARAAVQDHLGPADADVPRCAQRIGADGVAGARRSRRRRAARAA